MIVKDVLQAVQPEIPFVPEYMIDAELTPDLPEPPARIKSRKLQGEIQSPMDIQEEVLKGDRMEVPEMVKQEPSEATDMGMEVTQTGDHFSLSLSQCGLSSTAWGGGVPTHISSGIPNLDEKSTNPNWE